MDDEEDSRTDSTSTNDDGPTDSPAATDATDAYATGSTDTDATGSTSTAGPTDESESGAGPRFEDVDDLTVVAASDGRDLAVTPREQAALDRARKVSELLDEAVRVPGTDFKIGLDPILGVVPVGGDAIAGMLSLYPIFEAVRLDAPPKTISVMLSLVAVDAVIGSVPVLGGVFDAFWKANQWNVRLLERTIEER